MTDSVEIRLNLKRLSTASLKAIDYDIGSSLSIRTGEMKLRFIRRMKIDSPLSGTGMCLQFKCDGSLGSDEPTAVSANINVPNATVGQNYLHCTSVPLAVAAALGLVKVHLAAQGVSQADLLALDESAVTLRSLTLTYLIATGSRAEAESLVADMASTLKLLDDRTQTMDSSNQSFYLQKSRFAVKGYNKTDEAHMQWLPRAPIDEIRAAGQKLVRIEVALRESFLKAEGLTSPAVWKGAPGRELVEKVWGLTVAKVFRMNDDLRHRAPRESVITTLTPVAQRLLRGYLKGKSARTFRPIIRASVPAGKLNKLRTEILAKVQVDVGIPWVDHQALKNYELKGTLASPRSYSVPSDLASWCFCKANWPAIRAILAAAAEVAVAGHLQALEDEQKAMAAPQLPLDDPQQTSAAMPD